MKRKFKHTFDRIYFYNRWLDKDYMRPGDWTIIGIHVRWASYDSYCYRVCFFGVEVHAWFDRKSIELKQ